MLWSCVVGSRVGWWVVVMGVIGGREGIGGKVRWSLRN